ncbi:serine protease inhibitor-like superfamily [Holotrichia oblita]|uniref:Serine protease inhibitor-like superfamily n=1 Tax=Holotrichia oblita TaxID=644536 RepID=A0ACB9T764_HOLOL|nr:serine protease inhibitor-like superfamily [Holotrichia oblita]
MAGNPKFRLAGCQKRSRLYEPVRPPCPPLMQYSNCGTYCPSTCEDPEILPCVKLCARGCFCIPPYILRNEDELKCVMPSECPTIVTESS